MGRTATADPSDSPPESRRLRLDARKLQPADESSRPTADPRPDPVAYKKRPGDSIGEALLARVRHLPLPSRPIERIGVAALFGLQARASKASAAATCMRWSTRTQPQCAFSAKAGSWWQSVSAATRGWHRPARGPSAVERRSQSSRAENCSHVHRHVNRPSRCGPRRPETSKSRMRLLGAGTHLHWNGPPMHRITDARNARWPSQLRSKPLRNS